ncbi:phage holin family protein [Bacteroides sp. 224]|uniref:phage holin family protein n=1 Tax=Bacteroides sp. 224 TaxID=2302936 RepID=UPI0013D3285A|nr:phage holin family protein [Bacteroides sp. 224]NDV66219.1 phage holin family protein [Bacteroides sp. 224]
MFISDNSIKDIRELIREFKQYIELQKEYTKLELTEKLTIIFSAIILAFVLVTLGIVVLFYLSFSLAYLLAPHIGGLIVSYAIIAGVIILLMIMVYIFRKPLIITPLVNFFAKLFSNDSKTK